MIVGVVNGPNKRLEKKFGYSVLSAASNIMDQMHKANHSWINLECLYDYFMVDCCPNCDVIGNIFSTSSMDESQNLK